MLAGMIGCSGCSPSSEPAITGVHSSSRATRLRSRRVLPWPRSPSSTTSWPAMIARSNCGSTVRSNPTMPGQGLSPARRAASRLSRSSSRTLRRVFGGVVARAELTEGRGEAGRRGRSSRGLSGCLGRARSAHPRHATTTSALVPLRAWDGRSQGVRARHPCRVVRGPAGAVHPARHAEGEGSSSATRHARRDGPGGPRAPSPPSPTTATGTCTAIATRNAVAVQSAGRARALQVEQHPDQGHHQQRRDEPAHVHHPGGTPHLRGRHRGAGDVERHERGRAPAGQDHHEHDEPRPRHGARPGEHDGPRHAPAPRRSSR